MRRIVGRSRGLFATATGVIVGLAGVLLFVQFQRPDPADPPVLAVPQAVVKSAPASVGKGVRGPGIPPAPGASQNAPPDPNAGAPTANLKRVANALHLKYKSVTAVVTLPAGLGVTNRVDVSVDFDERGQSQRVTQAYSNADGNRILANLADNGGQRRRAEVVISLAEATGSGTAATYAVRSTVDLEPLYDVSLGELHAYLDHDCDPVFASEPHIYWSSADGRVSDVELSMYGGSIRPVPKFRRTFTEVGQSGGLKVPAFMFWEEEGVGDFQKPTPTLTTPLLPGKTHDLEFTLSAENDRSCTLKLSYRTAYTLRRYPNL
jgi:hypothetical protein